MKLSLAITTYNRYEMTVESFAQVIDDPRLTEILLLDDASTDDSYLKLVEHFRANDKVKVMRQATNQGMAENKKCAIALASGDRVLILDSDNKIDKSYIDAIYIEGNLHDDTVINCAEFAYPNFDFRKYSGQFIDYKNAKRFMSHDMFRCFLNCCNYVVPQKTYLDVYQKDDTVKEADTIAFNYRWLKAGYSFYIVPGCGYFHRTHAESGFMKNIDYNMKKAKEIENKIMQL